MFTGLISEIGMVCSIYDNAEGKLFTIAAKKSFAQVSIGDSVAVNGACLTVIDIVPGQFRLQAVWVTLQKTNLGLLRIGSAVNLELAVRPTERLGGHLVQGHVNGIGHISRLISLGKNYLISVTVPRELHTYLVSEGSITLDGVSLTIEEVYGEGITISIIPHTWQHTTLCEKKIGDALNIEIDIIAKYVEKFIKLSTQKETINRVWLKDNGY